MRKIVWLAAVAALFLIAAPATAGVVGGDANVFLGQKELADDDLDDLDVASATEYGVGVALDFDWPVMLTFDVLLAEDDTTYSYSYARGGSYEYEIEVETQELQLGVRYEFLKDGVVQPYIGGGVSYITLEGEITGSFAPARGGSFTILDDDDSDIGFFAGAGLLFRIREHFNLGVDVRWSDASAELDASGFTRGISSEIELDSGGIHYGVVLGYHW